jgi:hypothetical protein
MKGGAVMFDVQADGDSRERRLCQYDNEELQNERQWGWLDESLLWIAVVVVFAVVTVAGLLFI